LFLGSFPIFNFSIQAQMTVETGIIVLAAGASTRMGSPKQLLRQVNGLSLIQQAVQTAQESQLGPIVVVLGANAKRVAEEIAQLGVQSIVNTDWETGMGSSIAAGVRYLLANQPLIARVLIMLGDQPLLTSAYLKDLARAMEEEQAPLAVSVYGDAKGVPAVFSKVLFDQLLQLQGAPGAKPVIQQNLQQAVCVAFPEGILDIDTPEDWKNFQRQP